MNVSDYGLKMNDLTSFKNQIYKYGMIVAAICELVSLLLIGFDYQFLYGLSLGTAISIVNFNIMEFTLKRALEGYGSKLAFIGYVIRLIIYGGIFYASISLSTTSGIGTLIGFVTLKIAIYYLHGFKAKFSKNRKIRPEVRAEYERMDIEKESHKSNRLRDKIRTELSYKEDEDFYDDEDAHKNSYKTYQRRKLKKLN